MQALARLVAYIMFPPWAKWVQRTLLLGAYAIMVVAGYAATTLGHPAKEAGYIVIAGALAAIAGVLTRYYQLEATGIWPQIGGLVIAVIWLQIPPQNAILSGWLVFAYCLFLGLRLLELNLIAWRARREHEAVEALKDPEVGNG
jgi:hypothetical protein